MTITQFFAILRARWKIAVAIFLTVVVLVVGISLLLTKKYTALASVVMDVKPDPLSAVLYAGGANPGFLQTQIDIIQSDRVAYRVVKNLHLADNPEIRRQWMEQTKGEGSIEQWLGETFQKSMDVKPGRESNVINVTYTAPDPRFAAGLANAFVQAYMETTVELKVDPAKQYSTFFDQRAKEARDALEAAQKKLSAYQSAKGIIATDERLDVENTRLTELSSQLVAVQAIASESGSRQHAAGAAGDRMQEVLNNTLIAGLKADLSRGDARLKELSARYGDAHPLVIEAKANNDEIRRRLDTETAKVTAGVSVSNSINQQRLGELRASMDAQRLKIQQMKALRDESAVLVRDVENAQRAYDIVLQRLNQTSLESQATQSNVSVLTSAVPPTQPATPRLVLNAMVAVFVGVLLGVGVALMLELFDRRVRAPEDVLAAIGVPVLGAIPQPNAKRLFRRARMSQMQQKLLGQLPAPHKGA